MKKIFNIILVLLFSFISFACSSQDNYNKTHLNETLQNAKEIKLGETVLVEKIVDGEIFSYEITLLNVGINSSNGVLNNIDLEVYIKSSYDAVMFYKPYLINEKSEYHCNGYSTDDSVENVVQYVSVATNKNVFFSLIPDINYQDKPFDASLKSYLILKFNEYDENYIYFLKV